MENHSDTKSFYVRSEFARKLSNLAKSNATVKECLQYQHLSPFQTIVWELKNTVMKSYWNKEVGKTHYLVPYLPMGMDPLQTTFGKKFKSDATVGDLINPPEVDEKPSISTDVNLCRFRKTTANEGEQLNRNYNCHFNEHASFGKKTNADIQGLRIRRIIKSGERDSTTLVNHIQADYSKRAQLTLGQVKKLNAKYFDPLAVYGKPSEKRTFSVADALKETVVNDAPSLKWISLQYLHSLRDHLKKRIPYTHFFDIYEILVCLDKEYTGTLSEEDVLETLGKYGIHPEKELFDALLDILELRENGKLKYRNVVDMLNYKSPFPTLPITKKSKDETTTLITDETKSHEATPEYHICNDKKYLKIDNAYALIFPSIFTKYDLHHVDFFKIRSKEEIRSIFENIGIIFPNDSFDTLWEKATKIDGSDDGVCVDTFNSLLDSSVNDSLEKT